VYSVRTGFATWGKARRTLPYSLTTVIE